MNIKPAFTENKFIVTLIFVTSLFMFWGIAMTMGDILNRSFQIVLHVSKFKSSLVQFSIFGAYAVMGIPAGLFMKKFGYKNGVLLGLSLFALGAFLFIPAANTESFFFFMVALLILGCGMATLETTAHPFMASLGDEGTSDQRINFAQAFNAVGTVVGPLIGGYFILRVAHADGPDKLYAVKTVYTVIGSVIALIAVCFSLVKVPSLKDAHAVAIDAYAVSPDFEDKQPAKKLFDHSHFKWAVVAQFFNVAAQSGTWALFINYGNEKVKLSNENASYWMMLFMGMMLAGRFAGTFMMRFIAPNKILAAFALANIVMCIIVAQGFGWFSFWALLFINFFFSIMYPTIFSLGLKQLGPHKQQAASFIVLGLAGGAVFPPLMGLIANHDVATAYYLPIICYVVIFLFGYRLYKVKN